METTKSQFGTITWAVELANIYFSTLSDQNKANLKMVKPYMVRSTREMHELGLVDNPFDDRKKRIVWAPKQEGRKVEFIPIR